MKRFLIALVALFSFIGCDQDGDSTHSIHNQIEKKGYVRKKTFIQTSDDETQYINPELKRFSKFVLFGKLSSPKLGIGYLYISSANDLVVTQLNKTVDLNLDLSSFDLKESFYIGSHDEHTDICQLNYFEAGAYRIIPALNDFYKVTLNSHFLMYVRKTRY